MSEQNQTLPQELHKTGYDREAEYFHKLNLELIEKNRIALDRSRLEQAAKNAQQAHWMKCPKCGSDLNESLVLGLKGDCCQSCGGVYFDRDEILQLMATHEPHAFKETLRRLFNAATKPRPTGVGQFPV